MWRRKHHGDLWGGLLKCLKEVSVGTTNDVPDLTEDLLQPGDIEEPNAPQTESEDEASDGLESEDDDNNDPDFII